VKELSGTGNLIEPYSVRKKRSADKRAEGIAHKAAELAATYARLKLPVPMRLQPKAAQDVALANFIPFEIRRNRGGQPAGHGTVRATAIRGSMGRPPSAARATTIRGSRIGRPPSAALADAIAAGHRTYQGRPCPHGHSGLRRVNQNVCVECARLRQEAKRRGGAKRKDWPTGTWTSTERLDALMTADGYRHCAVCGGPVPDTRLNNSPTCSAVCARKARTHRAAYRHIEGVKGVVNH